MDTVFDLILISTFTSPEHIGGLLNSIAQDNQKLKIFHVIVNQSSRKQSYPSSALYTVHEIETFQIMSLSKARNIAIDYLQKEEIKGRHLMFPDDDALYNQDLFSNYLNEIVTGNNYLIDVKATDEDGYMKEVKRNHGEQMHDSDFFSVSSINMIISFESFEKVGKFNPLLSVGAKFGSSEDLDYFIRVNRLKPFIANKVLKVYHPKDSLSFKGLTFQQIIKRFEGYGRGYFYVIGKYKMAENGFISIGRAFGGFIHQCIKPNFKLALAYFYIAFRRIAWLIYFRWIFNFKADYNA